MGELRQFRPIKKVAQSEPKSDSVYAGFVRIDQIDVNLPPLPEQVAESLELQLSLVDLKIHLMSLTGSVSRNLIEEQKRNLQSDSVDQLRGKMLESTPHGWSIKPAYYQALLEMLEMRLQSGPAE